MGLCASAFYELVTDLGREGEIGKAIAVQMPELDLTEAELDTAETMGMGGHAIPARYRSLDRSAGALHALCNAQPEQLLPSVSCGVGPFYKYSREYLTMPRQESKMP